MMNVSNVMAKQPPARGTTAASSGNVVTSGPPARMDDAARWQAVAHRDRSADGQFVYAVRSTGIFCRPSCPSRRPRRDRVEFYASPAEARDAGFRPCRRCHPESPAARSLVERAIAAWTRLWRADEPVTLARLAAATGASPFHLQRTFRRELGLSPRDLTDAAKMHALKRKLRGGMSVTDAIYDAGFGSPSRVYERSARALGMTPRAYAKGGAGVDVTYTCVACSLGRVLVAATPRGICAVKLGSSDEALVPLLESEFPNAKLDAGDAKLSQWAAAIVSTVDGLRPSAALPLDIRGTAFQTRVWKALQEIPRGETRSYGAIARAIGRPTAARAVAQACGANPVCIAIPCHRVVQEDGGLGGYHWGIERKRALLAAEKK